MIYTFEINYEPNLQDSYWYPITISNPHTLAAFLGPQTTIRNFKVWGTND